MLSVTTEVGHAHTLCPYTPRSFLSEGCRDKIPSGACPGDSVVRKIAVGHMWLSVTEYCPSDRSHCAIQGYGKDESVGSALLISPCVPVVQEQVGEPPCGQRQADATKKQVA